MRLVKAFSGKWSLRILALAAALVIVPACRKDGRPGFAGKNGAPGASGVLAPAVWSDPINISQEVVATDGWDAYGQQAVFTPDGRLHVVYFAADLATEVDQLFYTSAAAPYTAWDAPVRLTSVVDIGPLGFDLTAAANNSVHVVFSRNTGGTTELVYTRNTAALHLAFTETRVYEELSGEDNIFSARILMRGTRAHVVWTGIDNGDNYYYLYSNSGSTWPTTTPVAIIEPGVIPMFRRAEINQYSFVSDPAGNFHLFYYVEGVEGEKFLLYRPLPLAAASLGGVQQVNDPGVDELAYSIGAPIVQFDSSNNIFVFWRRTWAPSGPRRAVVCNIKAAASATFNNARATVVTVDSTDDQNGLGSHWDDFFTVDFDVQVSPNGRIHAAWKESDNSYGTNDLYPVYYRTKDPGVNAMSGWQTEQVVAWIDNPEDSNTWSGGLGLTYANGDDTNMGRSVLLRAAADGTVHVFYSAMHYNPNWGSLPDLFHVYNQPGSTTWHSSGSLSRPTENAMYPDKFPYPYFLDVGIEDNGSPYALFTVDPAAYSGSDAPGDVVYTHLFAGEWAVGSDVNGPDHADPQGTFWVGQDPAGLLHAIWQQEVDPFNNSSCYDLMHSNSPDPSEGASRLKLNDWNNRHPVFFPE